MQIPKGHQAVMPYFIVKEATKFRDFVIKVFNAELTFSRLRDDDKSLLHAEIQINGNTIMFCDSTAEWKPANGNIFIYVDNADAVYKKAIDAGATTLMELKDQDYGRSCGVTDPFGNVWWITSVVSGE